MEMSIKDDNLKTTKYIMVEFEKIICEIGNQITLILKLEGILNQYEK